MLTRPLSVFVTNTGGAELIASSATISLVVGAERGDDAVFSVASAPVPFMTTPTMREMADEGREVITGVD